MMARLQEKNYNTEYDEVGPVAKAILLIISLCILYKWDIEK